MTRAEAVPRARAGRPKASDVIAADLRAQIISGGMPPGSVLPSEPELIARYRFSRGSVREALRLLEADGLIRIKRGPGGGVRVSHPDTSQLTRSFALLFATAGTPLRDLVRFRQLVEPAAAAEAARSASHRQQESLMDAAARLATTRVGDADLDFHRMLVECSNNTLLRTVLSAVQHLSDWHIPAERLSPQDIAAARRSHQRIALAIVRRDPEAAEAAMLRHLNAFEQVLDSLGRLDEPIIPGAHWRAIAAAAEHVSKT